MFLLRTAFKSSKRHWRKSVLYLLICAVAVLTLQIYAGNIKQTETQLTHLPEAVSIAGRITNSNGSLVTGLEIYERILDGLLESPYVKEERFAVLMRGGVGDFPVEDQYKHLSMQVEGLNTLAVIDGLEEDMVTWLPGCGPDLLAGDQAVCLMDTNTLQSNGLKLGDALPLNLYSYTYIFWNMVTYEPLEVMDYQIVGEIDTSQIMTNESIPQVILPFNTARAVFHRNDATFFADSFTFTVAKASELNTFKEEMKKLGLRSVDASVSSANMSNGGVALRLADSTFISVGTRLQESLLLLKGFLPLLFAALAAIGYFVAYLMVQNRREEYAVMRMLGISRRRSMSLYFIEMLLLTVVGGVAGMLISVVLGIGSISVGAVTLGIFFLCFMAGTVIALWNLGRMNVMLALSQTD